jgi:hypothetical protein
MKHVAIIVALASSLLLPAAPAHGAAQEEEATRAARAQMQKLIPRMQGRWKGGGWTRVSKDATVHFVGEETVTPQLGGSALLIEGLHKDARSGAVVHHALGILAWDVERAQFRMATALSQGRTGSHPGRIEEGKFIWTLEPEGKGPTLRFTIDFEPPGRWHEVGEISFDGGAKWFKSLEMTLERVPEGAASR